MKCAAILNLEVVNNLSMKYASCEGTFSQCTGLRGILNYPVFELCPGVSVLPLFTRVLRCYGGQEEPQIDPSKQYGQSVKQFGKKMYF